MYIHICFFTFFDAFDLILICIIIISRFDGGDCIDFNIGYPGCTAKKPFKVGDGVCGKLCIFSMECTNTEKLSQLEYIT